MSRKMVLNRDYTLATRLGHTIRFEKNVPTHVPPEVRHEALAIGAVMADNDAPVSDEPQLPPPIPLAERNNRIMSAIQLLMLKNDRTDFTAAGQPTARAVSRETGFEVERKEVAAAVQRFNEEKAGE